MVDRPDFCSRCPIGHVTHGYTPLKLRPGSHLGVGEASGEDEIRSGEGFSGGSGQWLRNLLKSAKIGWDSFSTLNVIGCHPPSNIFPLDSKWHLTSKQIAQDGVEYCKQHHMWPGVEAAGKDKIFAIGASACEALTDRKGINIWRGSPLPLVGKHDKPRVIPTIHPAALMRQAKLSSVVARDFRKSFILPPENYNLFPTLEEVEKFDSKVFAFDLEWDAAGNITVCGLSDRFYSAIVVDWIEPYISVLRGKFEQAKAIIGHNIIQADLPYIEKLGWDISGATIHDTMLKQHLVQPDFPHDLGFVASVFTNKVFWKGRGWEEEETENTGLDGWHGQQWRTWDRDIAIPRELGGYGGCRTASEAFHLYNARDTDAEFQINTPLSHSLTRYELDETYTHVSVPIAYIVRGLGDRGLNLDSKKLATVRETLNEKILVIEAKLPKGLKPYDEEVSCNLPAPPGTFKAKVKSCKGTRKTPHVPYTITFNRPHQQGVCEHCQRQLTPGKMGEAKIIKGTRLERVVPYNSPPKVQAYVESLALRDVFNTKSGKKTTGKKARQVWAKDHPEFTLLGGLKEHITLRNNFAKDSLLAQKRMYFNLKVHGTSEGRLSSTGKRDGVDLNIQNQPKAFRSIYIPDHAEWGFLSLDVVQGENMLTAWIAQDWDRWERLNQPGYNEHADLASRIAGRPIDKNLPEDEPYYKVGKVINHGKNYGAGPKKCQEILLEHGYEYFTLADMKEADEIWKKMNARTAVWQQETIETATKQGFLRNVFGRARWFSTRDIASKALAFLPASTLADMVLRMMMAHYPNHPRVGPSIQALKLQTFMEIIPDWIMSIQVHDELVFQGPWEGVHEQADRSTQIMTQPWAQLGGFRFNVDVKGSNKSWGECKKLD